MSGHYALVITSGGRLVSVASKSNLPYTFGLTTMFVLVSMYVWRQPLRRDAFLRQRQIVCRILFPPLALAFGAGSIALALR